MPRPPSPAPGRPCRAPTRDRPTAPSAAVAAIGILTVLVVTAVAGSWHDSHRALETVGLALGATLVLCLTVFGAYCDMVYGSDTSGQLNEHSDMLEPDELSPGLDTSTPRHQTSTPTRHLDTPCQLDQLDQLDTPRHPSTPSRLGPCSSMSRCQTRHLDTPRHPSTPLDTTSTPLMILTQQRRTG